MSEHVLKNVNFQAQNKVLSLEHIGCDLNNGYGDLCIGKTYQNGQVSKAFFIDCGASTEKEVFDDYYQDLKNKLSFVLLTHWHDDHYGGWSSLNKDFKLYFTISKNADDKKRDSTVKAVQNIVQIDQSDVFVTQITQVGTSFFGTQNVSMYIATPFLSESWYSDENHYSLMPMISAGKFKYLGLADITKQTFPKWLMQAKNSFQVIRLPHHGSKNNFNISSLLNYVYYKKPFCIISGLGGYAINETIDWLTKNGVFVAVVIGDDSRKVTDFFPSKMQQWYKTGFFNLGTYLTVEVDTSGGYKILSDRKIYNLNKGGLIDC